MKKEQANETVKADETKKTDEKDEKTTDKVLNTTWDDIVAKAEEKTDAMYTELGKKTGTVQSGSYLDTLI